ncbi:inositol monophosphatase [Salinisphaera sp. USBA-960]|uniref:inositol monophosphatase family protein n=1 Tax=Salinisphaera orenii TaxID=856731 RepID=UPI000DBE8B2F|nr:inositol monophosphatase [Salifodinibacter halophilus]NNC25765.1 inositol monophosphatase [Salifodinibacter halophilus]
MDPLTNVAVSAARAAGDTILEYYRRGDPGQITRKGPNDYATEADQHAEQVIIQTISRRYPQHGFIAEESGQNDDTDTVWIIDPIDGTANFMHGLPHFCVSIACRIDGILKLGVIFDPVRNELFTAERGRGAELDGRRVRVSGATHLDTALLASGFAYRRNADVDTWMPAFQQLTRAAGGMRVNGSAALDLAYVACGRLDAFWEAGLHAWDVAAGMLLVRAAGGIVAPPDDSDPLESGHILASTPKLVPRIHERIKSG